MKDKDGDINYRLVQLEVIKPVIKYLFKDLLNEIKDFKCQITMKVLLRKLKENGDTDFETVSFNSISKQ